MRKLLPWTLASILLLFVTACSGGSYNIGVGSISSSAHAIVGNYNSFNGHYYRTAQFSGGEQVQLQLFVHTIKGTLTGELLDSSGVNVVTLSSDQSNQTVTIPSTGTYKIQVNGDHHDGDFDLAWQEISPSN